MILTEYQESAVHQFKDPSIHGLILWWNMGSGKTIGGLACILNEPGVPVNIICPEELGFVWTNEIKNLPKIKNRIKIYNFSNFLKCKTFENELVLVDEAQHLVTDVVHTGGPVEKMFALFDGCRKILLLTGTPVYTGLTDLSFLVNIAAKRQIVPYNYSDFYQKYYRINNRKRIVNGYFIDVFKKLMKLLMAVSFFVGIYVIYTGKSLNAVNKVKSYILDLAKKTLTSEEFDEFLTRALGFDYVKTEDTEETRKIKESHDAVYRNTPVSEIMYSLQIYLEILVSKPFDPKIAPYVRKLFVLVLQVSTVIALVYLYVSIFSIKQFDDEYRYFRTDLMYKDMSPYVNYYKNDESNTNFPSSKVHVKTVSYSDYQTDMWIKLTQEILEPEISKRLGMRGAADSLDFSGSADSADSVDSAAALDSARLNAEQYLDFGIFIGNLSSESGEPSESGGARGSSEPSPKFREILKVAKGKRAVFYSGSFNAGTVPFRQFLDSVGESHLFLDKNMTGAQKNEVLETFKNTRTFLVLHPVYTEGITIRGAEQIHLLEPFRNVSKKNQVIARVIRFGTHAHLPANKRHVDVYQWLCSNTRLTSRLNTIKNSLQKWLKYNREVFYSEIFNKYSQNNTPDQIVYASEVMLSKNIESLEKMFKSRKNKSPAQCCIMFPEDSQFNECMRRVGKRCSVKAARVARIPGVPKMPRIKRVPRVPKTRKKSKKIARMSRTVRAPRA